VDSEDAQPGVSFREFVRVLATLKPLHGNPKKNKLNTREDKIKCSYILQITSFKKNSTFIYILYFQVIYKMFDVNDDGKISQEEMFSVLTE